MIDRARQQNERTRSVKPNKHSKKVANVASMSAKGRAEFRDETIRSRASNRGLGTYSYAQT